jgi:two-component system OmpR family sensor kinase
VSVSLAIVGWMAAVVAALAGWHAGAGRRELVTRACHELRGPLTAARLGIESGVRRGEFSIDRMRAVELELDRAALALEDLGVAFERHRLPGPDGAPGHGLTIRGTAVSHIGDVASRSAEAWRPFAMTHGVQLRVTSASTALVRCDRRRLAQAAGNLIANAIEHGGGVVDVRTREDGDSVRLEVLDDGPGLPAPVAQITRGARGGRGARGRGLAIATEIADQHGGRISCAPSERGARMVLELPRWKGTAGTANGQADWPDPAR